MFQTKVQLVCSIIFFPSKSCAVYMWKNMAEPEMPQMAKWCMRFAFWITKATDKHLEYEIIIAFPQQQWFHKCTSMLCLYVHCPSWSAMTILHGLRDLNIHFWSDPHYFTVFPACTYETLSAKQQLDHLCHRVRGCQLNALASKLQSITFWFWHNYSNLVKYSVIKIRSVFKCSERWIWTQN
jgi:hypothetical protein